MAGAGLSSLPLSTPANELILSLLPSQVNAGFPFIQSLVSPTSQTTPNCHSRPLCLDSFGSQFQYRPQIPQNQRAFQYQRVLSCDHLARISSYPCSQEPAMKTFTLDEAQSLLPVLEALLKRAIEGKLAAEKVESDLSSLAQRIYLAGGLRVDVSHVTRQRTEMEAHLQRVRETIAEIDTIGVQVKDLDSGLLDFPCRIDDDIVLLCWRMGEPAIEHWHTVEAGFKGRQPVDERFRRRSNNRPN